MALSDLSCANRSNAGSSRLFANNSETAKSTCKASKYNKKGPVFNDSEYITTDTGKAYVVK